MWEEHRLRIFEGVLRRIFGPNRDDLIGAWSNLQNEERHNFYSTPNMIRTINDGVVGLT
jgi:hypothetical protein